MKTKSVLEAFKLYTERVSDVGNNNFLNLHTFFLHEENHSIGYVNVSSIVNV